MDISSLSIKEIKSLLETNGTEELWQAIERDERKGVQSLLKARLRQEKERQRVAALYKYENECVQRGHKFVAGVDEVGRGPLAGPVVVSAVILPQHAIVLKSSMTRRNCRKPRGKSCMILFSPML